MSHKILIATEKPFAPVAVEEIKKQYRDGFTVEWLEGYKTPEELCKAAADAEALIVRSDKVTPAVLDAAKKLKIVVRAGAGYDTIDVNACNAHKVIVMNTPGQNSNAVAELCFGIMITLARGNYLGKSGFELRGKKLGLHAYGAVSRCMARIAKGFGMEVCAIDPYIKDEVFAQEGIQKVDSVKELYSTCDYVSIHCPLTDETRKMVNADLLKLMKPNATLINSARDAVIDEDALAEHLANTKGFKYGADVAPKNAAELKEKFGVRVLFTAAKMGAQTEEANTNAGVAAIKQAMDYLEKGIDTFRVRKNKF